MTTNNAIKGQAGRAHASDKDEPSGGDSARTDVREVDARTPVTSAAGRVVPSDQPKRGVAPRRDRRRPCCGGDS